MLVFPMGHFGPPLTLRARPALTIIAVAMRGTIARQTKADSDRCPGGGGGMVTGVKKGGDVLGSLTL